MRKPTNRKNKATVKSKRLNKKSYEATVLPVCVSYSTLVDPASDSYMLGYKTHGNPEAKIFAMRKDGHNI